MNTALEQTIIEHLHALDDARLAEVLEFVERIHHRPRTPPAPLTGLFSGPSEPIGDTDPVAVALAELRQERAENLERTLAVIESGKMEQDS
jgi:hypothetical protein